MRTRTSRSPIGGGPEGAGGGADGRVTGGAGSGRANASNTSDLVMRSPGPDGTIAAVSSPLSATSLRTAGPERASAAPLCSAAPLPATIWPSVADRPSPASPRSAPSPAMRERGDPAGTAGWVTGEVG